VSCQSVKGVLETLYLTKIYLSRRRVALKWRHHLTSPCPTFTASYGTIWVPYILVLVLMIVSLKRRFRSRMTMRANGTIAVSISTRCRVTAQHVFDAFIDPLNEHDYHDRFHLLHSDVLVNWIPVDRVSGANHQGYSRARNAPQASNRVGCFCFRVASTKLSWLHNLHLFS
jgi:hypothetical protein